MAPAPLPPQIFDRALLARRLARTQGDNFVHALVREDLEDRLAVITRRFERALVLGPDARALPRAGRSAEGAFAFSRMATLVTDGDAPLADAEALDLEAGAYDLVVSLLDLQAINDVPGYLARIRAALKPDGLFLAAALGGRSLAELREAWLAADAARHGGAAPRVAPMIDVRDAGALLQRAGFALPVADLEPRVVRYADPLALMRELAALGGANPLAGRSRKLTLPADLIAAATAYAENFSDPDGRARATLELLWLSGWAPHESQQQPLKPGSAQVSLTKVLGRGG